MIALTPLAAGAGTDWTRILSDPDLVRHVGKLLQAYREAAPESREAALLAAMREIKAKAAEAGKSATDSAPVAEAPPAMPTPTTAAPPPFDPDVFSATWGDDRRRYPRIKCYVAVEMRVNDSEISIWGNLTNTSAGGCLVETASSVPSGAKVEIGLWVATGKIWVKGFALNGVVTRSGPSTGVRVRFSGMEPAERDNLRQFLKYVQETARAARSETTYLELLK